jgi:hypothetical protein
VLNRVEQLLKRPLNWLSKENYIAEGGKEIDGAEANIQPTGSG